MDKETHKQISESINNRMSEVLHEKINYMDNTEKALWLVAEGDYALLKIEASKGVWVTLIKERLDSPFSHIIEPLGIIREIEKSEQNG